MLLIQSFGVDLRPSFTHRIRRDDVAAMVFDPLASNRPSLAGWSWHLRGILHQSPLPNQKLSLDDRPIVKDYLSKDFSTFRVDEVIQLNQIDRGHLGFLNTDGSILG